MLPSFNEISQSSRYDKTKKETTTAIACLAVQHLKPLGGLWLNGTDLRILLLAEIANNQSAGGLAVNLEFAAGIRILGENQ